MSSCGGHAVAIRLVARLRNHVFHGNVEPVGRENAGCARHFQAGAVGPASLTSAFAIQQRFLVTPSFIRFSAGLLLVPMLASIAAATEEFAVFKSKDRGQTWFRSDTGLPHGSRINAFGALDEQLFAGTDSGIYLSADEALNWRAAGGTAMTSGRILSFATSGQNVFAGTDGSGLLVSANEGRSWARNAAFLAPKVRCLLAHAGKLYAGTDAEGVLVSNNDGQVWSALQEGLPAHSQVFALAMIEDRLFAGLYSQGLYAWNEREHRWAKTSSV